MKSVRQLVVEAVRKSEAMAKGWFLVVIDPDDQHREAEKQAKEDLKDVLAPFDAKEVKKVRITGISPDHEESGDAYWRIDFTAPKEIADVLNAQFHGEPGSPTHTMGGIQQLFKGKDEAAPKLKASYGPKELLPFWFVFEATPDSELVDVMGQYSIRDLMYMAKGGQNPEEATAYTNEADAKAEAELRIRAAKSGREKWSLQTKEPE